MTTVTFVNTNVHTSAHFDIDTNIDFPFNVEAPAVNQAAQGPMAEILTQ